MKHGQFQRIVLFLGAIGIAGLFSGCIETDERRHDGDRHEHREHEEHEEHEEHRYGY